MDWIGGGTLLIKFYIYGLNMYARMFVYFPIYNHDWSTIGGYVFLFIRRAESRNDAKNYTQFCDIVIWSPLKSFCLRKESIV